MKQALCLLVKTPHPHIFVVEEHVRAIFQHIVVSRIYPVVAKMESM